MKDPSEWMGVIEYCKWEDSVKQCCIEPDSAGNFVVRRPAVLVLNPICDQPSKNVYQK
jgi:hypothetical protein